MIGADSNLSAGNVQIQKSPMAKGMGVTPPRKIADSTTQDAVNNTMAKAYQESAPDQVQARQGFSNSAYQGFKRGLLRQQSLQKGASQSAAMEAEDQMANYASQQAHNQMRDQALADKQSNDNAIHASLMRQRDNDRANYFDMKQNEELQNQKFRQSLLGRFI